MSDDYGYSQPESADDQNDGRFKPSEKIQTLLPAKQQQQAVDNHLMLLLYRPSNMAMFNGVVSPDIRTWWMKLFVHYIKAKNNEGEEYTAVIVCNKAMNSYFSKTYGRPVIYAPTVCPQCAKTGHFVTCVNCGTNFGVRSTMDVCGFCDEADRWWHAWRLEWARQLQQIPGYQGRDDKGRYDLKKKNPDLYKQLTTGGTQLGYLQQTASEWTNRERYMHITWDVDKFSRRRPLAEGESETTIKKILFQGSTVFEALRAKHRNGKMFYDPRNGMAITLTRDTSQGMARTKYTVDDAPLGGLGVQLDQAWLTYLMDERTDPDASTEISVMTYDDQIRISGLNLTVEESAPQQQQYAGAPVGYSGPPGYAPPAGPPGYAPLAGPPAGGYPPGPPGTPPGAMPPQQPQGYQLPPQGPPAGFQTAPATPTAPPPPASPPKMGGRGGPPGYGPPPSMPPGASPPAPAASPPAPGYTSPPPSSSPPTGLQAAPGTGYATPPGPPAPPMGGYTAPPGAPPAPPPGGFQPAPMDPNAPRRKQWDK